MAVTSESARTTHLPARAVPKRLELAGTVAEARRRREHEAVRLVPRAGVDNGHALRRAAVVVTGNGISRCQQGATHCSERDGRQCYAPCCGAGRRRRSSSAGRREASRALHAANGRSGVESIPMPHSRVARHALMCDQCMLPLGCNAGETPQQLLDRECGKTRSPLEILTSKPADTSPLAVASTSVLTCPYVL